jgi:AcrR family transcriptional regulator
VATHTLLEEAGFGKLSIEGIAARAGVGKATIYRWWPGKGVLAMEAFLAAVEPTIAFPSGDSAWADLSEQVHVLAKVYQGKTGQILREMIGSGLFDAETMQLFVEGYLNPRRSAARQVLERGVAQGEFRRGVDQNMVIDAIYGPIFHRMLVGHEPFDASFIDALLGLIRNGIATTPAHTAKAAAPRKRRA